MKKTYKREEMRRAHSNPMSARVFQRQINCWVNRDDLETLIDNGYNLTEIVRDSLSVFASRVRMQKPQSLKPRFLRKAAKPTTPTKPAKPTPARSRKSIVANGKAQSHRVMGFKVYQP